MFFGFFCHSPQVNPNLWACDVENKSVYFLTPNECQVNGSSRMPQVVSLDWQRADVNKLMSVSHSIQ